MLPQNDARVFGAAQFQSGCVNIGDGVIQN
jgi:hypothetical protein